MTQNTTTQNTTTQKTTTQKTVVRRRTVRQYVPPQHGAWAMLLLEVGVAVPEFARTVHEYALADLRLGVRQKSFRPISEAAAMALIDGTVSSAMRTIALGQAPRGYASAVAATAVIVRVPLRMDLLGV